MKSLTHCKLNRLSHSIYTVLEESNFNFRHVRLWDLYIPRENGWTVCKHWRPWSDATFCGVWSVCQLPFYESPDYNRLKKCTEFQKDLAEKAMVVIAGQLLDLDNILEKRRLHVNWTVTRNLIRPGGGGYNLVCREYEEHKQSWKYIWRIDYDMAFFLLYPISAHNPSQPLGLRPSGLYWSLVWYEKCHMIISV